MTSIIFYDGNGLTDATRREGMIKAGAGVRTASEGVTDKQEAETELKKITNEFTGDDTTPSPADLTAILESNIGSFTILPQDKNGKYDLSGPGNRKLDLKGEVDELKGNTFRMTAVLPAGAEDVQFQYISQTIVPDVVALVEEDKVEQTPASRKRIEDYLIASFAFTRCR